MVRHKCRHHRHRKCKTKLEVDKIKAEMAKIKFLKTERIRSNEILLRNTRLVQPPQSSRGKMTENGVARATSTPFPPEGHEDKVDFNFTYNPFPISPVDLGLLDPAQRLEKLDGLLVTGTYHPQLINSSDKTILLDVTITPSMSWDWTQTGQSGSFSLNRSDSGNVDPLESTSNISICPNLNSRLILAAGDIEARYESNIECLWQRNGVPIPPTPPGPTFPDTYFQGAFLTPFLPITVDNILDLGDSPLGSGGELAQLITEVNITHITFILKLQDPADAQYLSFGEHSGQDHTINVVPTTVNLTYL